MTCVVEELPQQAQAPTTADDGRPVTDPSPAPTVEALPQATNRVHEEDGPLPLTTGMALLGSAKQSKCEADSPQTHVAFLRLSTQEVACQQASL